MPNSPSPSSRPNNPPNQPPHQTRSGELTDAQSRKPRSRFDPDYERVLDKLVNARKAAGVRQETIAKALGKTQSHVSMCENREREISIIDLWKWCLVLEIALSDFISDLEREGVPAIANKDQ